MVPSALAPSTDASFNAIVVSTPVTSNTQLTGSEEIIPLESFSSLAVSLFQRHQENMFQSFRVDNKGEDGYK